MAKEVCFTGTLSDIQKQTTAWKSENPHIKMIYEGPPIRVGYQDGESIFEKADWTITLKYEELS